MRDIVQRAEAWVENHPLSAIYAPEGALVRDLLAEVKRLRGECGELFIEREALQAKIDAAREVLHLTESDPAWAIGTAGIAHALAEALGDA